MPHLAVFVDGIHRHYDISVILKMKLILLSNMLGLFLELKLPKYQIGTRYRQIFQMKSVIRGSDPAIPTIIHYVLYYIIP